ncbi:adenylosuccinate lyase [Fusarium sp. MPI-SDFR-AT-0072]|nr:adenylosuccinate lyase [Fusarium sp. MPI-SDFR-AT-0072]
MATDNSNAMQSPKSLVITTEALEQMKQHLELIRRHDDMAHVHAFGAVAPAAASIIHYGATSCFVTDNTELILMRNALDLLLPRLPSQGYLKSSWQAGSSMGSKSCFDLESIEQVRSALLLYCAQGTIGTQASFLEVLRGGGSKCDQLNALLCKKTDFPACYERKRAGDIRHVALWQEAEKPFEVGQVGSNAMAFKRKPMSSERASRYPCPRVYDSAIRIDLPEIFILADAIIDSLENVTDGHRHLSSDDCHACPGATTFHVHGKYYYETGCQTVFKPIWAGLDSMLTPELYIGRRVEIVERYCGPEGTAEKRSSHIGRYLEVINNGA